MESLSALPNLVELDLRGEDTFGEQGLEAVYKTLPSMRLQALALPYALRTSRSGRALSAWWAERGGQVRMMRNAREVYHRLDPREGCGSWHLRKCLCWSAEY